MSEEVSVTTVGDGTARLELAPDLLARGWSPAVDVVRREVAAALLEHGRVETLVDPDDETAQRVATWSGMQREGVMRGVTVAGRRVDRVVYARTAQDAPAHEPEGFRSLLNSFLPRKRGIAQMLVRQADADEPRVLLCQLTYKRDWDLPGGVVEVNESPHVAVRRELEEELALDVPAGPLLLTDWLPPWSGWDDALCLVFDGGELPGAVLGDVVRQEREIKDAAFCTLAEVDARCADFTARRVRAALARVGAGRDAGAPAYTESGRPPGA